MQAAGASPGHPKIGDNNPGALSGWLQNTNNFQYHVVIDEIEMQPLRTFHATNKEHLRSQHRTIRNAPDN